VTGVFVLSAIGAATAAAVLGSPSGPADDPAAWSFVSGSGVGGLATGLLLLLASAGFFVKHGQRPDPLLLWFGLGSLLLATGRLGSTLPLVTPTELSPGVLLRIAGVFAFVVGAAREVQSYQHRLRTSAVLDERHRVARELHDGVAQDLAYIVSQAQWLASKLREPALRDVADAAERALADSRRAIADLRTAPCSVRRSITEAAEAAAGQAGLALELDLADVRVSSPEAGHDLARIVAEAIRNAARHGAARRIHVRFGNEDDRLVLCVRDDGRGFDHRFPLDSGEGGHWGLVTMRERAAALGGELLVESAPGAGTKVEVHLP
jgi:signal transduction histidine kinase